ncbi:queuine tRNA-ribosyltransferase catalytic subunit [Agrilus planipennis]|uniref:Queuine tRNA-ribosyltransferase catalytic subunit 1 n=1 Tax=Agrilus planipennis TaxID=224129 RepID=A0A1W4WX86_AGRPL|nr:queuine tRNA-ribosyltransferase catalytic subunit [Agrilus planipennis]
MTSPKNPLVFKIFTECRKTKARTSKIYLPHGEVDAPVFMPVGTQGTMKGLLNEQLYNLEIQIILANTYHLGLKPGREIIEKAGGLHRFMNWNRNLLTDSGGFQMVSLLKLAQITEEGVKFQSLNESKLEILLTPEHSIEIQNSIGADIIMQLDDVVKTTSTDVNRITEAVGRTSRWLDRCLMAHKKADSQSIFPIVQGGLSTELRTKSALEHCSKNVRGYAIGGLSGGESKDDFWKMVHLSTNILPKDKPRYVMGVGFAVDLVVCVALGADMFDCVFPTRTARFGCALIMTGQINLRQKKYQNDFSPIDKECRCSTCETYTRSYLHHIVTMHTVACHLVTVHNLAFQQRLMKTIRVNIKEGTFPDFVRKFMYDVYPDKKYPSWVADSMKAVNIDLIR